MSTSSDSNSDSGELSSVLNARDVSRDLFSASIGSICCCYTGQPLDTIKVRMQTSPSVYPNLMFTGQKIVYDEGIVALWKGAVPTALGMVAENAVAFGVNEALKRAFPNKPMDHHHDMLDNGQTRQRPDLIKPFFMGAITGCCSALVLLPSEIIKAKTQVLVGTSSSSSSGSSSTGLSSKDVYRKILNKQGYRGLLVGLDSQLMRDAPFYAVFFGGYELNCYLFQTYCSSFMSDQLIYFMSGGFAGMMGWTAAMPFDVPKTNVQSRWDTKVVGSYFPEMFKIIRQPNSGGILALYNGLGPTLLRAFPANAALFLGVETSKQFFDKFL